MPVQTHEALVRALSRGVRGGVFFLFGTEDYLKEEGVSAIVAAHLDPATRDFNLDQLRGSELDAEALASAVHTPPMMAEWRVVVLREAQALATAARARETIEALLARPPAGLALVLVATLPDRSKAQFYEKLKKATTAVEYPAVSSGDLPGWLMARAQSENIELAPEAARALAAAIGSDLGALTRELAKLRNFVGDRRRVTTDDVRAAVGAIPRQDRWAWLDLVGEARFREARAGLRVLLDAGESGVGLVIALGTHFLRLGMVAHGGERALEAELPTHQRWLAGRLGRQAKRWTAPALDAALEDLLRADRLLKSASLGDEPILEELLLRLEARVAQPVAS